MIGTKLHQVENPHCDVSGYQKRLGKICVNVKIQCTNDRRCYSAESNRCTQRYKAEIDIYKNKIIRKDKRKIVESTDKQDKAYNKTSLAENAKTVRNLVLKKREKSPLMNTEMELEGKN